MKRNPPRPWRLLALLLFLALPAAQAEGLDVGQPSALRKLVPASLLEKKAAAQYAQIKQAAASKGALAPDHHPQLRRLRAIAARLIRHADRWHAEANRWSWEINLIGARQINAFCMPGGKIAFFTGLIDGLKLNDDEIAAVMGHEIAHALREHARERLAKQQLTQLGAAVLGEIVAEGRYAGAFRFGGDLLALKFSRDDEREADIVGLDLAARAGFDPRAGITLWQKMLAASRNAPLEWFSTHPSGENRIRSIEALLPKLEPIYQAARSSG